jgi:hypothetical protein
MDDTRIAKTLATLRNGGLPRGSAALDNMFLQSINGTICSGCAEPIARLQTFYSVRIRNGSDKPLRLHPVCHDVWARLSSEDLNSSSFGI